MLPRESAETEVTASALLPAVNRPPRESPLISYTPHAIKRNAMRQQLRSKINSLARAKNRLPGERRFAGEKAKLGYLG
jgi:hypothetical protein